MRYLIPFVMLLSGCATFTYEHPGKTQEDFNRDKYDCLQVGTQYAANLGFNGNPMVVSDAAHKCMIQKYGYTVVKTKTRTTPCQLFPSLLLLRYSGLLWPEPDTSLHAQRPVSLRYSGSW